MKEQLKTDWKVLSNEYRSQGKYLRALYIFFLKVERIKLATN